MSNLYKGILYLLIGVSSTGKTFLMESSLKIILDKLEYVVATVTRKKRFDNENLNFISIEKFHKMIENNLFAEWIEYIPNNFYGYEKAIIDDVIKDKNGICTITEQGARQLIEAGYRTRIIKIYSIGEIAKAVQREFYNQHPERIAIDENREKISIEHDLVIFNSFEPGGKEVAIKRLVDFITKTANY